MGSPLGEQVSRETLAAWHMAPALPSQTLARVSSLFFFFCISAELWDGKQPLKEGKHNVILHCGLGAAALLPTQDFGGSWVPLCFAAGWRAASLGWKHPGAEQFVLIEVCYFGISF